MYIVGSYCDKQRKNALYNRKVLTDMLRGGVETKTTGWYDFHYFTNI